MANVTSHYDSPLGLPGGPVIPPRSTVFVEKWQFIKDHTVVKSWLEAGVIVADEDETATDHDKDETNGDGDGTDKEKDAENVEKDRLIIELAQFGIERNRRYSVETLREELDAALDAPSGEEGGSGDEGAIGNTSTSGVGGE